MKHGPPFIAGKNPAFFGPKNSNMTAFLIYHKFDLLVFIGIPINADRRKEAGALFATSRRGHGMELKATELLGTTAVRPDTIVATKVVESRVPSLEGRSSASRRIPQTALLFVRVGQVYNRRSTDRYRQTSPIWLPGAPSDVQPACMDPNPIIDPGCPRSVGGITLVVALCTALDMLLHI